MIENLETLFNNTPSFQGTHAEANRALVALDNAIKRRVKHGQMDDIANQIMTRHQSISRTCVRSALSSFCEPAAVEAANKQVASKKCTAASLQAEASFQQHRLYRARACVRKWIKDHPKPVGNRQKESSK